MVLRKTNKRKALGKTKRIFSLILLGLAVCGAVFGILYVLTNATNVGDPAPVETGTTEPTYQKEKSEEKSLPTKIDFQPVVDAWAESLGGNKSVLIYDLERAEIVGQYNIEENYNTASLYKLFVVYEGYRRVQTGAWQGDAAAGGTGYTISKCLDLAVRESYSPCAEALWAMIGHDELDNIIENDFEITNSDISRLTSNVTDIMKIMKIFYEHTDIVDGGLIAQIKDSFLNQPATTYNWRQGLPSGFSKANVYNKVGWAYNADGGYWNIYHDAAIVEFPESNRHFIVVVMTNQVPFEAIRTLGTKIEETFYNN